MELSLCFSATRMMLGASEAVVFCWLLLGWRSRGRCCGCARSQLSLCICSAKKPRRSCPTLSLYLGLCCPNLSCLQGVKVPGYSFKLSLIPGRDSVSVFPFAATLNILQRTCTPSTQMEWLRNKLTSTFLLFPGLSCKSSHKKILD